MALRVDDDQDRKSGAEYDDPFNSPDLRELDRDIDSRMSEIEDEERFISDLDKKFDKYGDAETPGGLSDAEEDDDETDDEADDEAGQVRTASANPNKDLFVPLALSGSNKGMGKRAKMLALVGTAGTMIGIMSVFGFLNGFRLKHLFENMSFQAFNKYNAAVERRSDKWVKAYTKIRLLEWEGKANPDGDGNLFFRANKIDTNNPVRDWYKTMRTSKFEEDLLKNQGIRFTSSIDKDGKVRPAVITIKGKENVLVPDADGKFDLYNFSRAGELDGPGLDNVANALDADLKKIFDDDTGGNKAARLAIRDAVNKETHKWQVIKRRQLRKGIANLTGVRDWRFFDKTRTKVENKKNEFKTKMIKKIFRNDDSRTQGFLLCALGLGGCARSTDASNPELSSGALDPTTKQDPGTTEDPGVDADGNPDGTTVSTPVDGSDISGADKLAKEAAGEVADQALQEAEDLSEKRFMKELIEKISQQFTQTIGGGPPGYAQVKKVLDWALKFNNNLKRGPNGRSKIGDSIYNYRMQLAIISFATGMIMLDQMTSGEADAEQISAAMDYFDGATTSEAFSYIMEGQSFPEGVKQTRTKADGAVEKVDKCDTGEPFTKEDYVPLCDKFKPNGGSRLSGLEDAWNKYVTDSPFGAILDGYKSLKDNVVVRIIDSIGNLLGDLASKVIKPIMDALGLTDAISSVIGWLTQKIMAFIGVVPCMTGAEDSGGMAVNCMSVGAAGTAETATRAAGGVLALAGSPAYNYSVKLAMEYNQDTYDSMSTYDKYFAMNNHLSFASNFAFNLSVSNNPLTSLSNVFSGSTFLKGFDGLGSLLQGKAKADTYKDLSDFSGVDTYAIPQQCIELDPLSPDYLENATNNPNIAKDYATLGNSTAYGKALYSKQGDLSDQELKDIYGTYNCAALDNVVRGGIGYTYGYSNDDGYTSTSGVTQTATQSSTTTLAGLNGYAIPCTGQPTPVARKYVSASDWSAIKDSGTIGTNSAGQPIKVYVREACNTANPRTVVIAGSIHGGENGGQLVAHELLFNAQLPNDVRIIAIPQINESGVPTSTRKNKNGVDLNRNNDYRWNELTEGDEANPTSRFYRGTAPGSEPETKALNAFLQSLGKTSLFAIYHSDLDYVAPVGTTPVSIATTYGRVTGMQIGNDGGSIVVNQHGSLDGWYNSKTGNPTLLVEFSRDRSDQTIRKHVDAIKELLAGNEI